jgi:cell division protein ZapE
LVSTSQLLIERLRERIAAGELDADAAQLAVVELLDDLTRQLEGWRVDRAGLIAKIFAKQSASPRGLYIHGAVGRGKTMLMDLFFEHAAFSPKARCHFHEFMAEVHDRIGKARQTVDGDPIPTVAAEIASQACLLCFDEIQVTDIADAMILGRLFEGLFARGVVVVATSNAAPRALYSDGLNRQLFLPFVALLERNMDVVELQAAKDYRLDKLAGLPLYFAPCDEHAKAELDRHWDRLTGRHPARPETLEVKGRTVRVPVASMGVARFAFADLCDAPLGALDYLHIAHGYHTLLIDGIPRFSRDRRSAARRFVNLIDTLYDNGTCLIASADAEPEQLYGEGPDAGIFARTVSRLIEMRSEAFLAGHGGHGRPGGKVGAKE